MYPNKFNRNQKLDAYLFSFQLGVERFGNNYGTIRNELNYICSTKLGLDIKGWGKDDSMAKIPVVISFRVTESGGEFLATAESIKPHPILAERERRLALAKQEVDPIKSEAARAAVWAACEQYTFGTEKERDDLIWVLAGMAVIGGLADQMEKGGLEAPLLRKALSIRWEEMDGRRVDFHAATVKYVEHFGDHVPIKNANYTTRWLWKEANLRLASGK